MYNLASKCKSCDLSKSLNLPCGPCTLHSKGSSPKLRDAHSYLFAMEVTHIRCTYFYVAPTLSFTAIKIASDLFILYAIVILPHISRFLCKQ